MGSEASRPSLGRFTPRVFAGLGTKEGGWLDVSCGMAGSGRLVNAVVVLAMGLVAVGAM